MGVNHEIWIKIANELSNDVVKVTPASIRVHIAKRKLEFLENLNVLENDNNYQQIVYGQYLVL